MSQVPIKITLPNGNKKMYAPIHSYIECFEQHREPLLNALEMSNVRLPDWTKLGQMEVITNFLPYHRLVVFMSASVENDAIGMALHRQLQARGVSVTCAVVELLFGLLGQQPNARDISMWVFTLFRMGVLLEHWRNRREVVTISDFHHFFCEKGVPTPFGRGVIWERQKAQAMIGVPGMDMLAIDDVWTPHAPYHLAPSFNYEAIKERVMRGYPTDEKLPASVLTASDI